VIPRPPVRCLLSLTVGAVGIGLRRDMTPISIFMEFIKHVRSGGGKSQRYVRLNRGSFETIFS
jgi:hypothetical protein